MSQSMDSLPEYESWIENTFPQNLKTSFLYFITANIAIKKSTAAEFYFISLFFDNYCFLPSEASSIFFSSVLRFSDTRKYFLKT